MNTLENALQELKMGRFILIYDSDDREGETDFVIASQFVTKDSVRRMRVDGGGLLCVTMHESIHEKLGIPFMTDVYTAAGGKYPVLKELVPDDIPYDAKSAFSITMNHRKTFTGITDIDRALTISEFAKFTRSMENLSKKEAMAEFGKQFRAPGHVTMLNAAKGLLDKRQGHTEFTTALMLMAGLAPTASICEMMWETGKARPRKEAARYAEENGLVMLSGEGIMAEWKRRKQDD